MRRWGVESLYNDYREMIEAERPDLVAICTRGELHAEMTVAVANAGVQMIFCEKAIACSMREADAVLEACGRNNVRFNSGVLRRFDSRYHLARRWIADGGIGTPRCSVHYAPATLMHGHIHSVDTLMYLLGDPKATSVWGELVPRDAVISGNRIPQDPHAVYRIEFDNGVEAMTIPAGNWEFEVLGSDGAIRGLNNGVGWQFRKVEVVGGKYRHFQEVPAPQAPSFSATQFLLEDLVHAFEENRPALGDVDICHRATEICLAVAESHRVKSRVSLPLANRDLYVWHV
jgi:predicted dehydrogenase